ncbi:MAG: C40 family peptidase [Gallintestinimicrobium sp.]
MDIMRSRFLEPCQGQEQWRKWAPQRPTVLTGVRRSIKLEPKEQEDADALGSEEAFRESIMQTAYSCLGTQYRWGGKTACGIDCSGLAFMSYFRNGILIWRDAAIKEGYRFMKSR